MCERVGCDKLHLTNPVPYVPRLPRKSDVGATRCHACHADRRSMSPSATPATQKAAASQATSGDQALATQNEGRCHQFLRLPLPRIKPADQLRHRPNPLPYVPRLPCKSDVGATRCHACHADRRSMSPSATLPRKRPRRQKQPMATKRLPRK